ncbi:MAG: hypothetical protein R2864_00350 [Syntrophotaleaceae bacterium]
MVDVGMHYDPQLNNFDHHQDASALCVSPDHAASRLSRGRPAGVRLVPLMSMMDGRTSREYFGVDASLLLASASPIDGYILSRFSRVHYLGPEDLIYKFMQEMGKDLLALIEEKKQRLERLKREAKVVQVNHIKAIVSHIADNPKLAMELYLRF